MRNRGIALLTTLAVGVILTILAVSLLALYYQDFSAQRTQQRSLQAYWNARSGVERYSLERRLPADLRYDFGKAGSCSVQDVKGDLVFEGLSAGYAQRIRLQHGNPALRVEN